MLHLPPLRDAWGTPAFDVLLKETLARMDEAQLPLQQGLSYSNYALGDKVSATILAKHETASHIHVKAGIFYTGIIAGCSCADDPTPIDEQTEYCEVEIDIRKDTAQTTIRLLPSSG
ncbi:MAG TPA: hypothetical protein EYH03_06520 [Chromatiales bacterium]|nr:hypothetical protein [Chromatiales bacterium]